MTMSIPHATTMPTRATRKPSIKFSIKTVAARRRQYAAIAATLIASHAAAALAVLYVAG